MPEGEKILALIYAAIEEQKNHAPASPIWWELNSAITHLCKARSLEKEELERKEAEALDEK